MAQLPILTQTEQVFANFAASASIAAGVSCTIYLGIDNTVKEDFPAVYIKATTGEEVVLQTGNWRVNLTVQVEEQAKTTSTGSLLAGTIFGAFSYQGIESDLNNSNAKLHVYEVIPRKPINSDVGNYWQQEMTFEVICMLQ